MAGLTTKFSVGDKVFRSGTWTVQKQHPCPDCKGVKKWEATSPAGGKYEMNCPRCSERFLSDDALNLKYSEFAPSVEELTIGSVRVDTNDDENPVSYMCRETGVGSGTVHYERDLFHTKDEAKAAAESKAKAQNLTTSWVVKQYDKTLSLSDYQLSNATIKSAKDIKYSTEAKIEMLFSDLRDCDTIEKIRAVLDGFSLREAA